ncbi:M16 family metallopeptidase [Williamwhitmania taraxaci]|uniref:Predicted Zn-dependent peptidase n=1 Tax=Williamwhitmania taraxaci TaxID=1640674 RepID=A0A1G6ITB2_9BACT|nr:pitrilysin family protein [Williamwhitmania taraxaci]SDC09704.1 Predicted Zn-dependent peptidase [Williamwhitmania taraxaci]
MQEFDILTLSNGIRFIHWRNASKIIHCGITINTGTRDEFENEHGLAHFIEHVIFKGTTHRKAYHVISRLEDVGGDLNAYTAKEETCIYATVLANDFERSAELISDILFNSTFPERELAKEKEVVFDEINSYKDSPAELIFDDFEEQVFANAPIGRNILGTKKNLKTFTKQSIQTFMQRTYNTDQMVFSSVGDIPFSKVKKVAEKYFGGFPANPRLFTRTPFNGYSPSVIEKHKSTYQAHCIVGNLAYDLKNEKRIALHLLINILGGPGMNSRLNLSLRERHGLAYNVEASYTPYSDTGIVSVYFGTDKENIDRSMSIVQKELTKIRTVSISDLLLFKAKKQLVGQLAIAAESNEGQMLSIGKSLLVYNSVDSLEEVAQKLETVTAMDLITTANEIFAPTQLATLIFR